MVLSKRLLMLLWTFTFYELFGVVDAAVTCPRGQMISNRGGCADCPDDKYQPTENPSKRCRACTKCRADYGSEVISECTKTQNRRCRCRSGFVPSESDFSTCKCDVGCGLKGTECRECEGGFFSNGINSPCVRWTECKATGVKVTGTRTTDAICNEASAGGTVPTVSTSNTSASLGTDVTSHAAEVTSTTPKIRLRSAPTTHRPAIRVAPTAARPSTPKQPDGSIGFYLLTAFGIVGLLLLTTVTCRLNIIPVLQRLRSTNTGREWDCRRPVEESGDNGPSSLDKLNPEDVN